MDAVGDEVERWLESAPAEEHPESVLARVVAELDATPQKGRLGFGMSLSRFVAVGIAAAALLAIVAIGVAGLPAGEFDPGRGPGASSGASSTPASSVQATPLGDRLSGIPPEGAAPSAPGPTRLVLSLDADVTTGRPIMRVYENGVVLWLDPADPSLSPQSSGFVQRRLTAEGVVYVRSLVLDTGLFDHDRRLHLDVGFFDLTLRTADASVRVVWARTDEWGLGPARDATTEEARALTELEGRLKDPDTWPAAVWADATDRPFVPSRNAVCLRSLPLATSGAHMRAELPPAVSAFLHDADRSTLEQAASPGWPCSRLTGDDLHELIRLLDDAGLEHNHEYGWLRYRLPDPTVPANTILVMFGPVLPDGELLILGPS
jgi:hypothetical protein